MKAALAEIDIKYAALLLVQPDGRCWLWTATGDPVEVVVRKAGAKS